MHSEPSEQMTKHTTLNTEVLPLGWPLQIKQILKNSTESDLKHFLHPTNAFLSPEVNFT